MLNFHYQKKKRKVCFYMPFKLSSFYRICKLIRLRSDILKNEAPMYKFKHKNRGDELTSSVFIVMHIKIGTIFKTPILRVPFTQVHPHISVWGWIVF